MITTIIETVTLVAFGALLGWSATILLMAALQPPKRPRKNSWNPRLPNDTKETE